MHARFATFTPSSRLCFILTACPASHAWGTLADSLPGHSLLLHAFRAEPIVVRNFLKRRLEAIDMEALLAIAN